MPNYSTDDKIRELIDACASLEPLALMVSGLLTELEEVAKTVESTECDDTAKIFFEICTGWNENDQRKVDLFQTVLILSIVEKMDFPDLDMQAQGGQGFHYWADKCSVELMEMGGFFFEQEEPEELELVLSLIKLGKISEFAQPSILAALHEEEVERFLTPNSYHIVWLGAFANSGFATRENIQWLIENFPNNELIDLVNMIEQVAVTSSRWELPFLYFSGEERVSGSVIAYLIEILEKGYQFRNDKEEVLASSILDCEVVPDRFDNLLSLDNFLSLAVEVCSTNEDLLRRAQNSSLASLVEAVSV